MEQIGPYRILGRLGEGGMGTVYKAEQQRPVRRLVAIKLVRVGFDSEAILRRFEQERQALAVMNHDAIAKVFDAGAVDGRPYFVMELVDGQPITDYCDERSCSLQERITLFQRVCQGVQHAHQKGVIHRDIKPNNVLVEEVEGAAQPKIIDFGLARATDQQLIEQTLFTEHGQVMGTPGYMSPEQAGGETEAIDTRSDVYSLGTLLYELLSGVLPFSTEELREAGILEAMRKIREDVPPRPSTRVSDLGSTIFARGLRGDLDWIVMKAIAKEPERRYDSASELAADLGRYLANEPVLAGPPSAGYRLRKLVRRYRGQVVAAGLIVVTMFFGLIAFAVANARARDNARLAEERAATAQRIQKFLVDLFEKSSPYEARGNPMTIRAYLDEATDELGELDDQPATQAQLRETLGHLFTMHGEFDKAKSLLSAAVRYRESHVASDPTALARSLHMLASNCAWTSDYEAGERFIRRAIAIHEREVGEHVDLAENFNVLGNILQRRGEMDAAEAAHRRALDMRRKLLSEGDAAIAQSLHNLGILRHIAEDYAGAIELYEEAIAIESAAGGKDNHDLATSMHTLALVYTAEWRLDKALARSRESLEIRERVLGKEHPHVALSLTALGTIQQRLGKAAVALPMHERAVRIAQKRLVETDEDLWWHRASLVRCQLEAQRTEAAIRTSEKMIAAAKLADDKLVEAGALSFRAEARLARGEGERARADLERGMSLCREAGASESDTAAEILAVHARLAAKDGATGKAESRFQSAIRMLEGVTGPRDADLLRVKEQFAALLDELGHAQRAQNIRRSVADARRRQ